MADGARRKRERASTEGSVVRSPAPGQGKQQSRVVREQPAGGVEGHGGEPAGLAQGEHLVVGLNHARRQPGSVPRSNGELVRDERDEDRGGKRQKAAETLGALRAAHGDRKSVV